MILNPRSKVLNLVAHAIRNAIRANRFARIIRNWTPIFIACPADSHESLEFPIRANHPIRANRANRFARIMPLRCWKMHFPTKRKQAFSYSKMHIPCRKMRFPAEECSFLQKNAVLGGGHMAGNLRKSQEGFRAQESRTLANFHKTLGLHKKICATYEPQKWPNGRHLATACL